MKSILFIYTIVHSTNSLAQEKLDTIFYNDEWNVTTNIDSVTFYRIVTKLKSNYKVDDYYKNNILQMTGFYSSIDKEVKDGNFKFFYSSGKLESEGLYVNNLKEGEWKTYKDDKLWILANYMNDSLHGSFTSYYKNGEVKRFDIYSHGKLKNGVCYDQKGNDTTYYDFIIMPEFIGGEEMYKYIYREVVYPLAAREHNIEGTVIVRFYIDEKGDVRNPKIISNTNALLNNSVMELFESMPKWNCGRKDGDYVKYILTLPVVFNLDE